MKERISKILRGIIGNINPKWLGTMGIGIFFLFLLIKLGWIGAGIVIIVSLFFFILSKLRREKKEKGEEKKEKKEEGREEEKGKLNRGTSAFWKWFILGFVVAGVFSLPVLVGKTGWIGPGIGIVLFFLFVRFITVEEGTAKAVMVFGEFSKIIFRWRDHWMDTEWNIWRENEEGSAGKEKTQIWSQRILGGLSVYFRPFQKIHQYKHRWTDIRLKDSKMEVEFHEEEDFNHVLLKPAVYAFKLTAVETKPPERIPVDVLVLVTLRIRNPYSFLFVAPPTPVEDILARISAETRALVTSCQMDDLLQLKGSSLWELLIGAKVIEDTLEKWGVKLAEKGIEIREIDLPPEYQRAAAAKREEELKAAGRAEEIMGTVISAVARADGRKESEVQAEFLVDPQGFHQKHQRTIDNTMTKLSMEERAYLRIETPGATGFGGELLRLIGAWQRMPTGKGGKGAAPKKGSVARGERGRTPKGPAGPEKKQRKREEEMSHEERLGYYERLASGAETEYEEEEE